MDVQNLLLQCSQGYSNTWPSDLVLDHQWPSFKFDRDFMETNVIIYDKTFMKIWWKISPLKSMLSYIMNVKLSCQGQVLADDDHDLGNFAVEWSMSHEPTIHLTKFQKFDMGLLGNRELKKSVHICGQDKN